MAQNDLPESQVLELAADFRRDYGEVRAQIGKAIVGHDQGQCRAWLPCAIDRG